MDIIYNLLGFHRLRREYDFVISVRMREYSIIKLRNALQRTALSTKAVKAQKQEGDKKHTF